MFIIYTLHKELDYQSMFPSEVKRFRGGRGLKPNHCMKVGDFWLEGKHFTNYREGLSWFWKV